MRWSVGEQLTQRCAHCLVRVSERRDSRDGDGGRTVVGVSGGICPRGRLRQWHAGASLAARVLQAAAWRPVCAGGQPQGALSLLLHHPVSPLTSKLVYISCATYTNTLICQDVCVCVCVCVCLFALSCFLSVNLSGNLAGSFSVCLSVGLCACLSRLLDLTRYGKCDLVVWKAVIIEVLKTSTFYDQCGLLSRQSTDSLWWR
jgi:hypothetical protein